jgi:hypothetical protein
MSNDDNIPNESGKNEEERKRCEMNKFANEYFSIRDEMEKLEKEVKIYYAIREKFVKRLIPDVQALSVDFYPEFESRFPVGYDDLHFKAELLFDDVVNLCDHYIEEKTGYFRQLYKIKFEFTTSLDLFSKRVEIPKHHAIMEVAQERFEEEYVDEFYFECYQKQIHFLLKRLTPNYIPEIYDLSAQGFRELDGYLYISVLEILDIICKTSPTEVT